MAIHIDIIAELQERAVRRAADRLEREFGDINAEVGVDVKAAEIRAAAEKIRQEFHDIRQEVKVDVDRSALSTMARLVGVAHQLDDNVKGAVRSLNELGRATAHTARGVGILTAPLAGLTAIDLAKVIGESTKSMWLMPAAATAAAAGIGTLKIATLGFSDAISDIRDPEKFATALASLSPNAQQAALSIQNLLPQIDTLKNATQDALFAGMGEEINKLANEYLPTIQTMTTSIATSFNQMIKDVGTQLMTPETRGQIENITTNISAAFRNAVPAVKAFAQAFIDIADVGSDFLPGIGTSISVVAQQFADFIRNAKETGQLKTWIEEGIDAVKSLAGGVWELIQAGNNLYQFFTSGSGIDDFKDDMEGLRQTTALLGGDFHTVFDDIRREFEQTTGPARAIANFWLDIPEALALAVNKSIDVVNTFIDHVNNAVEGSIIGKILRFLGGPGSSVGDIPHIPNVPNGGDWGDLSGPSIFGGPGQPTFGQGRGQPNRTSRPALQPGQIPGSPYGGPFAVPGAPPPGGKPSDKERREAIAAGIDPSLYRVDPFAGVPGGYSPVATTGGPTGPSMYGTGPVGMKYNAFGQPEGYGAYQADPQKILEAQHKVESEAHDLEQARRERLILERDNLATAQEVEEAKWKEQEAGWSLQSAQADLADAMQGTWEKMDSQTKSLTKGLDDIGASLDADFGISKGLPGIAENLTKFIANLATADALGRMNALVAADPHKGGYGLMGIMGAQGAFGPQFTGLDQNTQATTGGPTSSSQYSGLGGFAQNLSTAMPGMPAPGESARDFAHRVMMPFWESQGLTVGDHAADQYGEHQHGALDIMVPNIAEGNRVLQQVLSDPNVYGAIFNRQSYGYGHGATPQAYTGDNPHTDHVHAWYKPGDPNNITPGGPTSGYVSGTNSGMSSMSGYSTGGLSGIPIPLPVTIAGGGFGGAGMPMVGGAAGLASPAGGLSPQQWNSIMGAEAGGSGGWAANTGNGYYGGLQFSQPSWDASKPAGAPARADLASPEQQMAAGNKLLSMQGPGAWPTTYANHPEWFATTAGPTATPGTWAGPTGLPSSIAAGGGQSPAFGAAGPSMFGQAAGTRIGGLAPPAPNPGGGGVGIEPGGTIDTAMGIAASMFPGVGQAAATGMKLASRAIEYAGQVAGIGASGLMETFLPTGGSELANNSWLTRIVGGLAGAAPALPNIAGGMAGKAQMEGQAPVTPTDVASGQGQGKPPGPNINLEYHNHQATEDRAGADITNHLQTSYQTPGRR